MRWEDIEVGDMLVNDNGQEYTIIHKEGFKLIAEKRGLFARVRRVLSKNHYENEGIYSFESNWSAYRKNGDKK